MSNIERSYELAKKALKLLMKHALEATPNNFEVVYNYCQSYNKSLIEEVNAVFKSDMKDKSHALREIYVKYISGDLTSKKVEEITNKMADEVDQVSNMISAALGDTSVYGEALGEATSELDTTSDDGDAIRQIVQVLLKATVDMEQNSSLLESKLAASNRQIFELSENLSEVQNEARTDQLTGISNRKHFDEIMAAEIMLAQEEKHDLCVLIGDIDHFKRFNDTYGHQTGDQVLRLVATTLNDNVKGRDNVSRYGGEEFAIVLTKADIDSSEKIGNQIREAVQTKELIKRSTGENLGSITMCFGVALYRAGETIEEFISRADQALYLAKESGRNQVKTENDLLAKKSA